MATSLDLYCIKNIVNGKKYIGITKQGAEHRFRQHVHDAKRYKTVLHRAIKKYGKENFVLDVLYTAENYLELLHLEKKAIQEHGTTHPNGYNMTHGGDANWMLVTPEQMAQRQKTKA